MASVFIHVLWWHKEGLTQPWGGVDEWVGAQSEEISDLGGILVGLWFCSSR